MCGGEEKKRNPGTLLLLWGVVGVRAFLGDDKPMVRVYPLDKHNNTKHKSWRRRRERLRKTSGGVGTTVLVHHDPFDTIYHGSIR